MSAPKRWLDDASTSGPERQLLEEGLSLEPPDDAQGQVWAALLAKIPPPGAPPAGGGGGAGKVAASTGKAAATAKAAGTVASAGVLKSALIGAGAAVALITGYSVEMGNPERVPQAPPGVTMGDAGRVPQTPPRLPQAPPVQTAAPEPSTTPSAAPSAEPVVERRPTAEPHAATTGAPAAASADPAAAATADRETMTREESRMVGEANDALRRGDPAGALGLLEQIRQRFPAGVLVQEREALTIEALARSGKKGEASARAAAFLKAHPTSTLASRVQPFVN